MEKTSSASSSLCYGGYSNMKSEETDSASSSCLYCVGYSIINFEISNKKRMDTFRSFSNITSLTKNWSNVGFVYTGTSTHRDGHVTCVKCFQTVKEWETKRVPYIEHYMINKECSVVQMYKPVVDDLLPVDYYGIQNDRYSRLVNRVSSFGGYECMNLPPGDNRAVARAGFFYEESSAQCFCCGTVIKEWKKNDIPLCEHYKVSPECPFLGIQLSRVSQAIESTVVNDLKDP